MPVAFDPRAAALDARAVGAFGRAVEAWRTLLQQHPGDWAAALELKRDLKASGRYPDADPLFRRAARHLPDPEWLAHYTALYAFHMDDLGWLEQRATEMLRRRPNDPALHALRADAARQRRDWPAAAAGFAEAARLNPGNAEHAAQHRAALTYGRIGAWLAQQPPHGDEYGVAFINLGRNVERRAWTEQLFGHGPAPLARVPAVEGHHLPHAAVQRLLDGAGDSMRGTLGCFLSHAAAWESLAPGRFDHLLVIEDDVIPLLPLPPQLGPLGLPPGYDICFVNDRLEPRLVPGPAETFSTRPLADAMLGFPPDDNAPGADGYFVSRRGAAKLLAWVAQDGFAGDVDWRLLAYGMDPASVAVLPGHAFSRQMLQRLHGSMSRPDRLDAHVLHPALIRTVGVRSDREDNNRGNPA